MSPFWNMYDSFKDRRYGGLFLACLVAFFGLLIFVAIVFTIIYSSNLQEYFLYALSGVGLLAAAWIWMFVRRARAGRRERLRYLPLSRDEMRVARSKLLKDRNPKKS
jgi:hypothetical protein